MAYNKYKNRKVRTPEGVFDSEAEYLYWLYLKSEQEAGRIKNLSPKPTYTLLQAFVTSTGKRERAVRYTPDFRYETPEGKTVVVEVKGARTQDYIIRRKLFQHQNPHIIFIEEKA